MTTQDIWISILAGILVNIVTGVATYLYTSYRNRVFYGNEAQRQNARIAEIAINHLHTSYLSAKRLRYDVLSHIAAIRRASASPEVFGAILDGIARSLEQERISMLANMKSWKDFLSEGSDTHKLIKQLQEDNIIVVAPSPTDLDHALSHTPPTQSSLERVQLSSVHKPTLKSPASADALAALKLKSPKEAARALAERLKISQHSPEETVLRALMTGDVQQIAELKGSLGSIDLTPKQKFAVGAALAILRDRDAIGLLKSAVDDGITKDFPVEGYQSIIGSLVGTAERHDLEAEVFDTVGVLVKELLENPKTPVKIQAWAINQQQKLMFSLKRYEEAIASLERVVKLAPDDPHYLFNLGLCYEKAERSEQALETAETLARLVKDDPDHLMFVARQLDKAGRSEEAQKFAAQAESIDPFKAFLLAQSQELSASDDDTE